LSTGKKFLFQIHSAKSTTSKQKYKSNIFINLPPGFSQFHNQSTTKFNQPFSSVAAVVLRLAYRTLTHITEALRFRQEEH